MKFGDRFLFIRRALLISVNPKLIPRLISFQNKDGKTATRFFCDESELGDLFRQELRDKFVLHCKSSQGLKNLSLTFMLGVEEQWNRQNPNDQIVLVEKNPKQDDHASESC